MRHGKGNGFQGVWNGEKRFLTMTNGKREEREGRKLPTEVTDSVGMGKSRIIERYWIKL